MINGMVTLRARAVDARFPQHAFVNMSGEYQIAPTRRRDRCHDHRSQLTAGMCFPNGLRWPWF
jgi:hypothetical protein